PGGPGGRPGPARTTTWPLPWGPGPWSWPAPLAPLAFTVDKAVSRSLQVMFDGRSTVAIRADGPGMVVDLSAVPLDSEAMALVMVAAAAWLGRRWRPRDPSGSRSSTRRSTSRSTTWCSRTSPRRALHAPHRGLGDRLPTSAS
ncbi:MAG: hypothetical protein ACRD03_05675, partial [Acidimicrobiales bacterium]